MKFPSPVGVRPLTKQHRKQSRSIQSHVSVPCWGKAINNIVYNYSIKE